MHADGDFKTVPPQIPSSGGGGGGGFGGVDSESSESDDDDDDDDDDDKGLLSPRSRRLRRQYEQQLQHDIAAVLGYGCSAEANVRKILAIRAGSIIVEAAIWQQAGPSSFLSSDGGSAATTWTPPVPGSSVRITTSTGRRRHLERVREWARTAIAETSLSIGGHTVLSCQLVKPGGGWILPRCC